MTMRFLRTATLLIFGLILGIAGHVAWQFLLNPSATATGILQQEPETAPGVSASYPAGLYVESRVYLETASADLLGRKVTAWGSLDLARDPDAPSYPKIRNSMLTVVK